MNQKETFSKYYNDLNPEQKLAVDTIEGPVLVIAGPGTGKTQILGARIGKILLETDTDPGNISLPDVYRCRRHRHAPPAAVFYRTGCL